METKDFKKGTYLYDAFDYIYIFLDHLKDVTCKESALKLCAFIASELKFLSTFVQSYADECMHHLPLPEDEPQKVDWYTVRCKLGDYADEIADHSPYTNEDECADMLKAIKNMNTYCGSIFNSLQFDDEGRYSDYAKNLKDFLFSSRDNERVQVYLSKNISSMPTGKIRKNTCHGKTETCITAIANFTIEDVIDRNRFTLYYNVLGRQLWAIMHTKEQGTVKAKNIFKKIKELEVYAKETGVEIKFENVTPSSYTNAELKRMSDEERSKIATLSKREKCKNYADNRLQSFIDILFKNSDLFNPEKFYRGWVTSFFDGALRDKNLQVKVYKRLNGKGPNKFICEFVREMYDRGCMDDNVTKDDIIARYSNEVDRETVRRYFEHGFDKELSAYLDKFCLKRPVTQPPTE